MKLNKGQAFKILRVRRDGTLMSTHGGTFTWDPPIQNKDKSWIFGGWTPPVDPVLCSSGYHLTNNPLEWWDRSNLKAFLAEYKGENQESRFRASTRHKISVRTCRLLRPLTADELVPYGIFMKGEHKVSDGGRYVVLKSAKLIAEGSAIVNAYDRSKVTAKGFARVNAHNRARVDAWGQSLIRAYDSSVVEAHGKSEVYAWNKSDITPHGHAKVHEMTLFKGFIRKS